MPCRDPSQEPSRSQHNGVGKGSSSGTQQGLTLFDLLSNNKQAVAAANHQRSENQRSKSRQHQQQQHKQAELQQQHPPKKPRVLTSNSALTSSSQAPAGGCLRASQVPGCDVASYIAAIKLPSASKQQDLFEPSRAGAGLAARAAAYGIAA
jgi:hypothetical protein